jgi:CitB family two-component system response regulator MalR
MIRVLIVEDDPMVAEFNRRYLEKVAGFVLVATAKSAREALDILDRRNIDLILLDIFMPGMNGLELLTTIREKDRDVDVIIVSAASDNQTIKKALRYGAVDYLVKPFEFERLNKALTAYRDGVVFMRKQAVVNQTDLDQRILHRDLPGAALLPKGLDRNTLKTIWQSLDTNAGEPFTTEELANRIGISRVSARKYLQFLLKLQLLELEVAYGFVGRPLYKYRYHGSRADTLKQYL